MSKQPLDIVLADNDLPDTAKVVYTYLYRYWQRHRNVDGKFHRDGNSKPLPIISISQRFMSEELQMSKNTVCSAMTALRKHGYIGAVGERGARKVYTLHGDVR